MMCQNMKCIVSKFGDVVRVVRIRILVMFRVKSVARAVSVALMWVFGLMFDVDRIRIRIR